MMIKPRLLGALQTTRYDIQLDLNYKKRQAHTLVYTKVKKYTDVKLHFYPKPLGVS